MPQLKPGITREYIWRKVVLWIKAFNKNQKVASSSPNDNSAGLEDLRLKA